MNPDHKMLPIYRAIATIILFIISTTLVLGKTPSLPNNFASKIDFKSLPGSSYYQDKLYIKIIPEAAELLTDELLTAQKGYVVTGIPQLDELNKKYNVIEYKPLLHGLYDISPRSVLNRDKHRIWGFHLWFILTIAEKTDIKEAMDNYLSLGMIEIAEPVLIKKLIEPVSYYEIDPTENLISWAPNDTQYSEQWGLNNTGQEIDGREGLPGADIEIEPAWEIETGHSDVIVAVFDQGFEFSHTDMEANVWDNIGPDGTETAPGVHGTFVAGIIGAVTNNNRGIAGIAGGSGEGDGVRLMSLNIFQQTVSYSALKVYAVDNGAAISQNSWAYNVFDQYNAADLVAITYFNTYGGGKVLDGGITIFGAGNDDSNQNQYPAYFSETIAVAATNNRDRKSGFSNYGEWIDISAPGSDILSTNLGNSFSFSSGTSFACPFVSGVTALVISNAYRNRILLTNEELKYIILAATDNIYPENQDYFGMLGTGRVNAHSALLLLKDSFLEISEPQIFIALAYSHSLINLQWLPNMRDDKVMIIAGTTPVLGKPVSGTSYDIGEYLPDGGSVIYKGSEAQFNHTNLQASTTYYYHSYSYNELYNYSIGVEASATTHSSTSADESDLLLLTETVLKSNYPNPFNPNTVIGFSIAKDTKVELIVYNLKGQEIKRLLEDYLGNGSYSVSWDGFDKYGQEVSSGIYLYRLKTDDYDKTFRMLLLR